MRKIINTILTLAIISPAVYAGIPKSFHGQYYETKQNPDNRMCIVLKYANKGDYTGLDKFEKKQKKKIIDPLARDIMEISENGIYYADSYASAGMCWEVK